MGFSWAENYPEIYKMCSLFSLEELQSPTKYCYKPLPSYLQKGPQCGIVALAMALGRADKDFVESLLSAAIEYGYTYNGEMFSAQYLVNLAQLHLPRANVQLYAGSLNDQEMKDLILAGKFVLVPYDTNKCNSPCLENGKTAHWAVISGGVVSNDFYVLARHGKVRNVAIWKLSDLAQSNSQLYEVGPSRLPSSGRLYKIPDGGIGGDCGLREKAVVLSV